MYHRTLLLIGAVLLFIGAGCVGAENTDEPEGMPVQVNADSASQTQQEEASAWKTYVNTNYRYSVRHPAVQSPWVDVDEDSGALKYAYNTDKSVHFSDKFTWALQPHSVGVNAFFTRDDLGAWANTEGRKFFSPSSTVAITERKIGNAVGVEMVSDTPGELGSVYRLFAVKHAGSLLVVTQEMPEEVLDEIYNSFTLLN